MSNHDRKKDIFQDSGIITDTSFLTPFLEFKDANHCDKYDLFAESETSLKILTMFLGVEFAVNCILIAMSMLIETALRMQIISCARMIALVPPTWLVFVLWNNKWGTRNIHGTKLRNAGSMVIILHAISFGLPLLGLWGGKCIEISCSLSRAEVPVVAVVTYVIVVLFAPIILKCHSFWAILTSLLVEFAFLIIVTKGLKLGVVAYVSVFLVIGMQVIMMYIYESYCRRVYIAYINLESSLRRKIEAENEIRLMEMQSAELKHLIGNVAHDLKTPLHAIAFELDTLQSLSETEPNTIRQSVKLLQSVCSFMSMTINRAIDYTKATSGIVLVPSQETVDLEESLRWVLDCMGRSSPGNSATVPIVIAPLPRDLNRYVITDRQWFLENLLCLASNAQKFTYDGCVNIRCTLKPQPQPHIKKSCLSSAAAVAMELEPFDGGMVLVEVEDSGIGIPEAERVNLFQPFKQTQRRAGGTGLGLFSLSKRVEALGGSCNLSSRSDGNSGCVFSFSFPYRPDLSVVNDIPSPSQKSSTCPTNPQRSDSILSKLSVLLVEDSLMIQKTTARIFQRNGCRLDFANNGAQCLQCVKQKKYDLILMDIQMPVMDGLEATKRLRAMETDKKCVEENIQVDDALTGTYSRDDDFWSHRHTIIGLSANSDSESAAEAMACGMDAFLPKPLSMWSLMKSVESLSRCQSPQVDADI
jgi:signal transduction histidine kinase/DNA-binding NarL/FixJ family response regulator